MFWLWVINITHKVTAVDEHHRNLWRNNAHMCKVDPVIQAKDGRVGNMLRVGECNAGEHRF